MFQVTVNVDMVFTFQPDFQDFINGTQFGFLDSNTIKPGEVAVAMVGDNGESGMGQ